MASWREADEDHIALISAGVAFYFLLALVPLLGAIVLSYGLLAAPATVVHDVNRLASVMPQDAARLVGQQLMAVVKASEGKKGAGVLGALAVALFGARSGATAVLTALNVAYEVKEGRSFIALNGIALAMILSLVIAVVSGLTAMATLGHAVRSIAAGPFLSVVSHLMTYALLGLVGAGVAATLYRFGPSRSGRSWTWITPGSVLTALFWLVLTLGFGFYASRIGHYDVTYGSLGAVVVLLTWFYLSGYALLLGAELNSECEKRACALATDDAPLRQDPMAATAIAERLLAAEVFATLPYGLASAGLARIRRRNGGGVGLMFLAAVLSWLRGFGSRRGRGSRR